MTARPGLLPLLACGALALLASCSHYHLGTATAGPGFDRLFVAPVVNAAYVPQAAPLVATQVRTAFARDGRVVLADASGDSARLDIRLVSYEHAIAAVLPSDTALGRKFNVSLTAEITVTDASGKKLIDRRTVRVSRDVFSDSGQQPAEYQTLPLIAEALATEIAHAVLDTW